MSNSSVCLSVHLTVHPSVLALLKLLPIFIITPVTFVITEDAEPFAADLPEGSTLKRASPLSPPESQSDMMLQESPAISSSEVSSPSVTPANFDFQKPEPSDPVSYSVLNASFYHF